MDDRTDSHPDHDGLRARHLDGWTCTLCDAPTRAYTATLRVIADPTVIHSDGAFYDAMSGLLTDMGGEFLLDWGIPRTGRVHPRERSMTAHTHPDSGYEWDDCPACGTASTDDRTASHPDHDGLRARHLDGWTCTLCDANVFEPISDEYGADFGTYDDDGERTPATSYQTVIRSYSRTVSTGHSDTDLTPRQRRILEVMLNIVSNSALADYPPSDDARERAVRRLSDLMWDADALLTAVAPAATDDVAIAHTRAIETLRSL